ncbi:MAG: heavy metal-responsive transcriptional regulator [Acidimicrobiia bacterium]|nr:heavy metal-responsive transcriptional regulator [Acidimicrobiia bacterium]
MRIGQLAEEAGVTTKTIRYYESIGLLHEPARSSSGYRAYDPSVLERLQFIRDAQQSGLSLSEIASVLELKEQGTTSCQHTRSLLTRHLEELDEQIRRLQETHRVLLAMAERASSLDPSTCTDPNRCQVISRPPEPNNVTA